MSHLLDSDKMFENVYQAYREHEDESPDDEERDQIYRKALEEKGSLFASHPTIAERFEAIGAFPTAQNRDDTPARTLLTDPDGTEKELTEFLTAYVYQIRQLQALAAAEQ